MAAYAALTPNISGVAYKAALANAGFSDAQAAAFISTYSVVTVFNDPASNFIGKSWSMYNAATKLWQQTWVDNQAGYIVLTGKYADNKMILSTALVKTADGKENISRMIFYNISKNSFDWNWEKSTDNGSTWNLMWQIHYKRKT